MMLVKTYSKQEAQQLENTWTQEVWYNFTLNDVNVTLTL